MTRRLPSIVVLDAVVFSNSHIEDLKQLGTVTKFRDNPNGLAEILNRARRANILVSGWTQLDAATIDGIPQLELISLWATGSEYVDTTHARAKRITVTNTPAYAGRAVAELALGLLLALARNIVGSSVSVRNGQYDWGPFEGVDK